MARSMFPFGAGRMYLKTSTALGFFRVGVAALQEGNWAIDVDVKELHGANRFPVDVRTATGKVEGSAKFADWDADTMAALLGVEVIDGSGRLLAVNVAGTVPASASYTITPTVPLSGSFVKNLEVIYGSNNLGSDGLPLEQVAPGNEAEGKFSVSAGVYTFAAADAGRAVRITYMYSVTGNADMKQIALNNTPIGVTPVMSGAFQLISDNKQMVLELDYVVPYGLKWGQRLDDWASQDINLKAFADPSTDVIGRINLYTPST